MAMNSQSQAADEELLDLWDNIWYGGQKRLSQQCCCLFQEASSCWTGSSQSWKLQPQCTQQSSGCSALPAQAASAPYLLSHLRQDDSVCVTVLVGA